MWFQYSVAMLGRTLKLLTALAVLALPAQAQTAPTLEAEVARIYHAVHTGGPYYTWDQLRAAVPDSVRWHLAPPDEVARGFVRRTGWIAHAGVQAGVSVCGSNRVPELMSIAFAASGNGEGEDQMLARLRATGLALQEAQQRGRERYFIPQEGRDLQSIERRVDCTPENARAAQTCRVIYTMTIRPLYRFAPVARACNAP